MKNSDATTGNGVTEENPVTRLMETVSKIIEFGTAHRHEPKRIVEMNGNPNPLITLEFSYSKSRDAQRLLLAKEFGNRLKACYEPFIQAGYNGKTICEWSIRLREPVQALLYFEESFRQQYAKRASIGLATLPETAVTDFVGWKIGEVASARQPFQEMEDLLPPVPAKTPHRQKADKPWLKNGSPPTDWHQTPLCGELKRIAGWLGTTTKTLRANNGRTHWIIRHIGCDPETKWPAPFAIYFQSSEKFATVNGKRRAEADQYLKQPRASKTKGPTKGAKGNEGERKGAVSQHHRGK